jgi:hypothetical protein
MERWSQNGFHSQFSISEFSMARGTEMSTSAPISRIESLHDRSSEAPQHDALERARDGGTRDRRRQPERQPPANAEKQDKAAEPESTDQTRGTLLDVIA